MAFILIVTGLCVLGFAIYAWCSDKTIISVLLGIFVGVLLGGIASIILSLPISAIYYTISDNYVAETQTYDLTKYNIEGEEGNYYIYMSNRDGKLTSSAEYFDEDDCPQIVNIENRTDYIYEKNSKPSIEVTTYNAVDSIWVLEIFKDCNKPLDKYVVTLPDSSVIYYSQK